jgi:hypothetical protein
MLDFDHIASAIARKLNAGQAVLDGEIVCVDASGRAIPRPLRAGESPSTWLSIYSG